MAYQLARWADVGQDTERTARSAGATDGAAVGEAIDVEGVTLRGRNHLLYAGLYRQRASTAGNQAQCLSETGDVRVCRQDLSVKRVHQ